MPDYPVTPNASHDESPVSHRRTTVRETSGPTSLIVGNVADGQFLKRVGNQIVGAEAGGGASYLVYTALLTQTGTDAPVATVLENTLGGTVVWTYDSAGLYFATLAGAFANNVGVLTGTRGSILISAEKDDADSIFLETVAADTNISVNNALENTFIEIRVYP